MGSCGIIGFGCAGYHGAKALRDSGYTGEIHVFTDEAEAPGNPMLTTYVAGGKLDEEQAFPFGQLSEVADRLKLEVHHTRVEKLYSKEKKVTTEDGQSFVFDKILIAAGAEPVVPDMEGSSDENVLVMRTMKDSRKLKERLERQDVQRAVVVGASMAGIKVAEILNSHGAHCILNDFAPHIFPLAALDPVAQEIEARVKEKGIQLIFGTGISRVRKAEKGIQVELTDGTVHPCDLAVLCIGTRVNKSILDDVISTGRGILVNASMETSAEGIYAAGDCAEGRNLQTGEAQLIGLWANAAAQGRCAGSNMAGISSEYEGNIVHNITHFMDMDFVSFGDKRIPGELQIFKNRDSRLMIAAAVAEGEFTCVNILGDYRNTGIIKSAMMRQMRGSREKLDPFMEEKLRQQGIDPAFINILGGAKDE